MLLMPDKKKLASVIVARMKAVPGADGSTATVTKKADDEVESDSSIALGAAFDKLAAALERKDTQAGVEALKEFLVLVDDDKDEDEENPEEPR